jgi:very-short-patch-repair endonuclease
MLDPVLRRLARDQWVRLHGTPRVTVLVGGARGRDIWYRWLALSAVVGTLLETAPARGSNGASVDEQIRAAVERAVAEPGHPIAVLASADAVAGWRAGRRDRLAAMVDEGWLDVPDEAAPARTPAPPRPPPPPPPAARPAAREVRAAGPADTIDARSLAEATLFEALEATPATAGRFQLNESLPVRFGPTAAEIDLLSRADRIAIEIDGIHHFADPDCYRRDRRKDLLLQTQGFVVVRLLAEDVVRDARAAVTAVCQALAYRRGEAG